MDLPDEADQVLCWRRKEVFANTLGFMYCLFAALYVFAFSATAPAEAFMDYTMTNVLALVALLVAKPLAIALFVGGVLKSRRAPQLLMHFPQLCDFSLTFLVQEIFLIPLSWSLEL